jgi:DNA-binding MarR family transcriptional regulator
VRTEGLPAPLIVNMLRIDRTTMVTLIDDLERKGFAVRQRHPRDRRVPGLADRVGPDGKD